MNEIAAYIDNCRQESVNISSKKHYASFICICKINDKVHLHTYVCMHVNAYMFFGIKTIKKNPNSITDNNNKI